jgi:hypothetical protein
MLTFLGMQGDIKTESHIEKLSTDNPFKIINIRTTQ